MDLRKNLPVQSENPQPSNGSVIFKSVMGLLGIFLLFPLMIVILSSLFSSPSQNQNISQPQKRVAEVMNQSNSKIGQNALDVLNHGSNKLRNNASNIIAQRSTPQRPVPQSSKPPQSAPKPVAQVKPTAPRPTNVARAAGKTTGLLNTAVTIGKFGLAIISKGKIRIR